MCVCVCVGRSFRSTHPVQHPHTTVCRPLTPLMLEYEATSPKLSFTQRLLARLELFFCHDLDMALLTIGYRGGGGGGGWLHKT